MHPCTRCTPSYAAPVILLSFVCSNRSLLPEANSHPFFHDLPLVCFYVHFFSRPLVGSVAGLQQWAMAQRGVAALEAGPLNRFGLESTYYNKGLCGQQCRRHTPLYCGVLYRCSCRAVGTGLVEGQVPLNISFYF